MHRITSRFLIVALLPLGSAVLSGCIVAAPRPVRHVRVVTPVQVERVHVWVPGYWAPRHVWVEGHWRYR